MFVRHLRCGRRRDGGGTLQAAGANDKSKRRACALSTGEPCGPRALRAWICSKGRHVLNAYCLPDPLSHTHPITVRELWRKDPGPAACCSQQLFLVSTGLRGTLRSGKAMGKNQQSLPPRGRCQEPGWVKVSIKATTHFTAFTKEIRRSSRQLT